MLLVTICFSGLPACRSSSNSDPVVEGHIKQELLEVGEIYRLYSATNKKPPKNINDLHGSQVISPTGYQAVRDGSIVVFWSVPLSDTSEEGSTDSADEVLAYEKAVQEQGGQVLMKNRTVQTMSADEFKVAPKAGQ